MSACRVLFLLIAVLTVCPMNLIGAQFREIHLAGAVAVKLISCEDSISRIVYDHQAPVDIRMTGGTLFIVGEATASPLSRVSVTLYGDCSVKIVEVSGRASLQADLLFSHDDLSIVASGASTVNIDEVKAANVNVSLSGSGSIDIGGSLTASTLNFSLVGSGSVKAASITASRMTVNQRGSGNMTFYGSARDCYAVGRGTGSIDLRGLVASAMDLKLLGSGRIYYPAGVRVTIGGDSDCIIQVKPYQPL